MFRTVVAEPALRGRSRLATRSRTQILPCRLDRSRHYRGIRSDLGTAGSGGDERSCRSVRPSRRTCAVDRGERDAIRTVSEIRSALAIILAACLAYDRLPLARWLALASALGLAAAIAWTGHAGSTPGEMGLLHLTADALHLLAAAAWTGGLVPFASAAGGRPSLPPRGVGATCARCDTTLLDAGHRQCSHACSASGIVNAWISGRLRQWADRYANMGGS